LIRQAAALNCNKFEFARIPLYLTSLCMILSQLFLSFAQIYPRAPF
jgi:hypothetical protein